MIGTMIEQPRDVAEYAVCIVANRKLACISLSYASKAPVNTKIAAKSK